jgi:hypothetical protein
MVLDLHEWLITALAAVLIAASLSLQSLPTGRVAFDPKAVCERPGFPAFGLVMSLH